MALRHRGGSQTSLPIPPHKHQFVYSLKPALHLTVLQSHHHPQPGEAEAQRTGSDYPRLSAGQAASESIDY